MGVLILSKCKMTKIRYIFIQWRKLTLISGGSEKYSYFYPINNPIFIIYHCFKPFTSPYTNSFIKILTVKTLLL